MRKERLRTLMRKVDGRLGCKGTLAELFGYETMQDYIDALERIHAERERLNNSPVELIRE